MFLFEDFKYNEAWAIVHYGESYKHNNWYLDGIINDYKFKQSLPKEDIERFNFSVTRYTEIPDVNNLYKISYAVHYAYKPDPPFKQDQIDYLTNKLSILGDAVKIIIPHYQGSMIIQYFIEKDEYRWNKEHARVEAKENAVNAITIPEPTEKSWLQMLEAYNFGKNPRMIFKKIKTLDELLEKLVIAIKIDWRPAISALHSKMYTFLKSDTVNKNNPLDNTYDAAYKYALAYNTPEYIQELMDDTNDALKHSGSIPTKAKHFAELLDHNNLVKNYSIKQYRKDDAYDIIMVANVELVNGNKAYITIQHPNLYILRMYKNIEFKNGYINTKYEDKIGKDYFSLPNKNRTNHVLNDTLDSFLDEYIIQDIYNMEKGK